MTNRNLYSHDIKKLESKIEELNISNTKLNMENLQLLRRVKKGLQMEQIVLGILATQLFENMLRSIIVDNLGLRKKGFEEAPLGALIGTLKQKASLSETDPLILSLSKYNKQRIHFIHKLFLANKKLPKSFEVYLKGIVDDRKIQNDCATLIETSGLCYILLKDFLTNVDEKTTI